MKIQFLFRIFLIYLYLFLNFKLFFFYYTGPFIFILKYHFILFLNFLFCIGAEPINSVVIVSGGQQRDSAIHIQVSILPQTPLPSRLPRTIGKSSLSYTIGPCWLSISNDISVSLKWSGVKIAQLCPTLCDPMDYTVHGILQARILEWVAFLFSRASSQPRDWTQVSCIAGRFFTNWATREAPVFLQSHIYIHLHIYLHVGLLYPRILPLQIQPILYQKYF